jgi:hypothetical protein
MPQVGQFSSAVDSGCSSCTMALLASLKLSAKHRADQYRSEQIYHVINSDLW